MIITATNEVCYVTPGPGEVYGKRLTQFILKVSGRKGFMKDGKRYYFETSQRNIEYWREIFPETSLDDQRVKTNVLDDTADFLVVKRKPRPPFQMGSKPYDHQARGFEKLKDLPLSAIFMGTGTGKTKMAIDKAVYWWCAHKIDGLLVLTKKGVHEQWVDEQLPDHIHKSIPYHAHAWEQMTTVREHRQWKGLLEATEKLRVFSINIDAIRTKKGFKYIMEFIVRCGGRVFGVIDESQDISDPESSRGVTLQEIRDELRFRAIMSGTPISTSLLDIWGQFHFLDTDYIGHKYKAPFRSEYCNMGGFQGNQIISHKNLEQFYGRIDDITFRATKEEELDLPEKVYTKEYFKLTDKQRTVYETLRKEFLVRLDDGSVATVEHAATAIMRLQQIACGFIVNENDEVKLLDNPRLDALEELEGRIGKDEKKIIWCRFKQDYATLQAYFGDRAVSYVGATSAEDRTKNKALFLNPNSDKRVLISNTQAGGTGLNLQGECAWAVYYSNNFSSIQRDQSEDRIHRIGTYKTTTFVDLVASRTVDVGILANLRRKRDFSTLVLDDIRKMMYEA